MDSGHYFADLNPEGHHGQADPDFAAFTAKDAVIAAAAARGTQQVRQRQDQASRRNAESLQGRQGASVGRLLADAGAGPNVYWSVPRSAFL